MKCDIILQQDYSRGLLRSPCDCLGWDEYSTESTEGFELDGFGAH